jgi:hypothetical protein
LTREFIRACRYAIKFFTKRAGFQRERRLYDKPTLRSMMPAVIEVVSNADNRYATADGFVFPPCLVVERGESLDEWARRIEPGFLTILSVWLYFLLPVVSLWFGDMHTSRVRRLKPS